jgi:hypothetical protein
MAILCCFGATFDHAVADKPKENGPAATLGRSCQPRPASAYLLGDSLGLGLKLAGMEVTLRAFLRAPPKISFDGGRSITTPGMHIRQSALQSVEADAAFIADAQVIIIVLGTNLMEADFAESQRELMRKLKALAPRAVYFWVDIGATLSTQAQQWSERNSIIYAQAPLLGYQVISRYKAIFGTEADPLRIQAGQLFPGYQTEPGYGGEGNIHGYDLALSEAILDALMLNQTRIPGGLICR